MWKGELGDISWDNEQELRDNISNLNTVISDNSKDLKTQKDIRSEALEERGRAVILINIPGYSEKEYDSFTTAKEEADKIYQEAHKEVNRLSEKQDELENKTTQLNKFLSSALRPSEESTQARKKAVKQAAKSARKKNHPYVKKARQLALEEFKTQDSLLTTLIDFDSWTEQGMGGLNFNSIDTKIDFKTILSRMSLCNLNSLTVQGIRCLLSGVTEDAALRKMIRVALNEMDIDVLGIFISNLPLAAQSDLKDKFQKEFGNLPLPWEEGYDPGSLDNTNAYKTYLQRSTLQAKKRQEEEKARAQTETKAKLAEISAELQKRQDDEQVVQDFLSGVDFEAQGTFESDLTGQERLVSDGNYDFDIWIPDGPDKPENDFRAWIHANYASEMFANDTVSAKLKSSWTRKNKHVAAAWEKYGKDYVVADDGLAIDIPDLVIPDLPEEGSLEEVQETKSSVQTINEESEKQQALQIADQEKESRNRAIREVATLKRVGEFN